MAENKQAENKQAENKQAENKQAVTIELLRNYYIANTEQLGVTCPVRVNEVFLMREKWEQDVIAFIATKSFQQHMANVTREKRAIAICEGTQFKGMRSMTIPLPSAQLGVSAGNMTAKGQDLTISAFGAQLRKLAQIFGVEQGATRDPLKNAVLSAPVTEGNKSFFTAKVSDGRIARITVEYIVEPSSK